MESVKTHFETEAQVFDETIRRLIPNYEHMIEALVTALPFSPEASFQVVDLGCGTGTVSQRVKDLFPNAHITCIDMSENMLEMAKAKLGTESNTKFIQANLADYRFEYKFDAALSSLALHHLVNDRDKIQFYSKIFQNLKQNGVFYNADIVLSTIPQLQDKYMKEWHHFMLQGISREEVAEKWITKHLEEDYPAPLMHQLDWLLEIGFADVDVLWKCYGFSVYGGCKIS